MAEVTDYQYAYFNKLIYGAEDPDGPVEHFSVFKESGPLESGLAALALCATQDGKGTCVFTFLGTDSSKDKNMVKGQMKTNYQLSQDPDEDMTIVREAVGFVRDTINELEEQQGDVEWKFSATGHSLGAFLANAAAVELDDNISKAVTFDSPGLTKYWRNAALGKHDSQYWKERLLEYQTFPNPINTTLPHIGRIVRLDLHTHNAATPGHVIRCALGTVLRIANYGSLVNLGMVIRGKTKGFWATKVVSVAVRTPKKLISSGFNVRKALQDARTASHEDLAARDTVSAQKYGDTTTERSNPMVPLLSILPAGQRPVVITGFWALASLLVCSAAYMINRASGNLRDTYQEHTIMSILTAFDEETGRPTQPVEMVEWPCHRYMLDNGFPQKHLRRVACESFSPFRPAGYGMHNAFRRKQMLLSRARTLPGFREAS